MRISIKKRRVVLWLGALVFVGMTSFVFVAWVVGGKLLESANRRIGAGPDDFPVEPATIDSESGSRIATWYASAANSHATMILVHGIRGNRLELLDRARLFHRAGYSVVMIDLQAHGESPGASITLGDLERHDVRAAITYARQKNPTHRIGIVGISLGGAAAVLASPLDVDALVLESVYPTIDEAVHDRVSSQVGALTCVLAPALLCQLRPRLGISTSDLRPIDRIAGLSCPVLIASGGLDRHTTIAETQRLFDAANQPKQLTIFQGAAHVDLFEYDPKQYEDDVLGFLKVYLETSETQ